MILKTFQNLKIVYKNDKPKEVILSWKDFQEIMEIIEDIYDLKYIKKLKRKKAIFKDFDSVLNV